jgi:phosphatidylglycerophosphate synthase
MTFRRPRPSSSCMATASTATSPASSSGLARAGTFAERYRRLHNRRAFTWWSTVFGYPIARLVLVPVVPIRWITPTSLTLVGFAVKLAGAAAIAVGSPAAIVAGFVLLQVSQVLDSMDGTLARARRQASPTGAFLDKLTDAVGLFAICAAVGARAVADGGGAAYPLLACAGAFACDLACYMYWVGRAEAPLAEAPRLDGGAEVPSWRMIRREWLLGWRKLPLFLEADLYLWIGLFGLAGRWRELCVLLAVTQLAALVLFVGHELRRIHRAHRAPPEPP